MHHGMRSFSLMRLGWLLVAAVAVATPIGAVESVSFGSPDLAAMARATRIGSSLQLMDVPLEKDGPLAALLLKRVEVFAPDAKIVVHHDHGVEVLPVPDNVYLRGHVKSPEDEHTQAFLTILASGEVRGILAGEGRYWMIGNEADEAAGLAVRKVDAERLNAAGAAEYSFQCGADDLTTPLDPFEKLGKPVNARRKASYTARVAVETDYEFYQLFGNSTDASNYVADIISYASGVYDSEVDTTLYLSYVSLWSTSSDPWTESGSLCLLFQFGRYWNNNHGATTRTIAHYMSGKSTGGGVAWVGVLCRGAFSVDTTLNGCGLSPLVDSYGGGYGFTGSLSGTFNINNPQVMWDIVAVTHEIGHNFNSPHTHCYGNIGGNANPVDQCNAGECGSSGCSCATPTLPCSGQSGCGTLMSYCHLLSGGMSNLTYTFGAGHPYGVEPDRVPTRMNDHVVARDSSYPGCLDFIGVNEIFADGFESGNTSNWSVAVGGV